MANIVIIGGGVAGLSAGIYARLSGHYVSIYEKHFRPGGNLTGWDREGYHIDNCIHWLTGTNVNTNLYSIWKELGVLGDIKVYQGKTLYTFRKNGIEVSLYDDIDKIKEEMLKIAPEDKKEILSFIKAIKAIQGIDGTAGNNNNQKSNLIEKLISIPILLKYYNLNTKELADKFKNPVLKGFIISLISEYFSSLALIIVFATFTGKNGGIPLGSSCGMAKNMCDRFLSLGGKLFLNSGVEKINVDKNKAESITLENGDIIKADYVITTIDPKVTFSKLLEEKYMPKSLTKEYNNPRMLRFSSYHCAFACDDSKVPFNGDVIFEIPAEYKEKLHSDYLIVREFSHEPSFAPKGKNILQTMIYCNEEDSLKFISLSKDRNTYRKRKEEISDDIEKIIVGEFPKLKGKLRLLDTWTPATYKRYTGSEIGSFMSFALPSKKIPLRLSNKINGLENVFLATQWLQPPGGLPIAAKVGKEAIELINTIT